MSQPTHHLATIGKLNPTLGHLHRTFAIFVVFRLQLRFKRRWGEGGGEEEEEPWLSREW
jgi:hypothetical protein